MISGTSKICSKFGPVDLLSITKRLQRIQDKLWNHPGKYDICQSGTQQISKSFEKMYVSGTTCVEFRFVVIVFCEQMSTYVENLFVEMRIGR